MDRLNNLSYVALASASPLQRNRRRPRRLVGDWVLLVLLVFCVLAAIVVARATLAGTARRTSVVAASRTARAVVSRSAPAAPPAAAPAGRSLHEFAGHLGPYSWDYRWGLTHPALGVPPLHANAAILVDLDTRRVLFSLRPHQRLAMASTTKLMTAMVALDAVSPSTPLTVPLAAAQVEPDVMGLTAGEEVPVRDLLYGLLLDSGNDAAETLAAGTLGRPAFVAAMNDKARRMGLSDTHFANPTGLDDPGHLSSAHDLALMAANLYQDYPLLRQVVGTRSASIAGGAGHKAFLPVNFDKMLWTYPGTIGFKTGLTDHAGYCLVSGAHRGNHTLVAVLLGDPLIFTDATALLDYGFRRLG